MNPYGESLNELEEDIEKMKRATEKEVLIYDEIKFALIEED